MSSHQSNGTFGKALDLWQAPDGAGDPLICIATTYTFDASFFETECVARFLQMDTHPSESASVAYLIEREEKLAGARVHALVDRQHARDKESLRWDIVGVLVPRAVQHAKLAVLAWRDHVRVVIGSGNLTEPGYRKNLEVFATIELSRNGGGNKAALSGTLDFLEEITALAVGAEGPDTPKTRLRESIRQTRQHVRSWPSNESRSDAVPVFNSPRQRALKQLGELWPTSSPPREVHVVSPFFDHPPNDGKVAESLKTILAKRGARDSYVYVKTEDLPDGRTRVFAPRQLVSSLGRNGHVEAIPLLAVQNDEQRDVHSKLLSLANDEWCLLMIGSSNFTSAGLGVVDHGGNCEANLVYRVKTADPSFRQLDQVWPSFGETELNLNDATLIWEPSFESGEGGAGEVPLPAAFEEALFAPGSPSSLKLTLADSLPKKWSIRVPASRTLLSSETAGVGVHSIAWGNEPPPFVLEVSWQRDEDLLVASWPVNVSNPAALPPPEALRSLTLEELLEILASTRPLSTAVTEVIRKRTKASRVDPDLDPLKRLDSQAFLLRRTKRVARALDRLKERLERPVLTKDAFEWRLRGAVGPLSLADAFIKEAKLPGEARFCLAELALTLRRVDPNAAASGGLSVDEVRASIDDVIRDIRTKVNSLESSTETSMLDSYVSAALAEATAK